jgi:hypothetical protein
VALTCGDPPSETTTHWTGRAMTAATGTFGSIVDLQAAINRYLAEHNADPKPFVWTATPASIIAKLD